MRVRPPNGTRRIKTVSFFMEKPFLWKKKTAGRNKSTIMQVLAVSRQVVSLEYLVWSRGGKLASTRNGHRPALLPGTPGRPFETLFPPGSLKLPNAYILRPPALSRRPPLCLNAGIQAGRRPNRRQIHCMQTASSDEISCRNRFLLSQKWELGS